MIECPECSAEIEPESLRCAGCGRATVRCDGFVAWSPELADRNSGFRPEYFNRLAELERGSFWFRGRNALIVWALRRYLSCPESYLEVGCGTGFVLAAIRHACPAARLHGSEIYSAGLAIAATRVPTATFVQMDGRRIPYREEFDVIGCFDVLEHIHEDEAVLQQMHCALRPGGGLLLTVPQHPRLWSASDELACHVRRYTCRELHSRVRAAGFEILRSTSFVSLLLPAMLLSRRKRSATGAQSPDPTDEHCHPPVVNGALAAILGVERKMIQAGINFPVGGSRLLVARKAAGREQLARRSAAAG